MSRDRAFLVVVRKKGTSEYSWEESFKELSELTRSAGGVVADFVKAPIERPTPNFFIRSGKLEEIRMKATQKEANLIIFNVDLAPVQSRNIEEQTGIRVVDRTGLILDIFARRAQSRAGRLQVELAQLNYLLPRLVGHGVIMSRLGGGIGTRGPGEQKLEVDRRKIRDRIGRLRGELGKLEMHRELVRKNRQRKAFPVVAIVGYTNAGKSTLLNALTGADAVVEDKLFATLDPMTRLFRTHGGQKLLLTDTVGFLADLPHALVEAFHATLEEVTEADVIIHVLDIAHPSAEHQYQSVCQVLEELRAHEKPMVLALNKIDILEESELARAVEKFSYGIPISAKKKLHLDQLMDAVIKSIGRLKVSESSHRTFD